MNSSPGTISGFIYQSLNEFRYLISHKVRLHYLLFFLTFGLSLYLLAVLDYDSINIPDNPLFGGMVVGDAPLTDILLFTYLLFNTIMSSGGEAAILIPADLGITLVIILSIFLALSTVSRFAINSAASSLSREVEAKTLYIIASTPNARLSIYLAKLTGAFLGSLPLLAVMTIGVFLMLTSKFGSIPGYQAQIIDITFKMVIMTVSTLLLFISLGGLISVFRRGEESAVSLSNLIIGLVVLLASFWMILPVFSILGEGFASMVEMVTMLSPVTQDMIVLYENNDLLLIKYAGIQLFIAILLTVYGIIVFNKKDIEY